MKDNEKPILIYRKSLNSKAGVVIPVRWIRKFGKEISMEIYEDGIILLKPLNK